MEQVITLRTRKAVPDVPEDVDPYLAHLNDPNYTFEFPSDASEESFELDDKKSPIDSPLRAHKPYNFDAESQSGYSATSSSRASSHIATSRAPLHSLDEVEDDSPYPEVRASVPTTDDPQMPANTFRAWFLGLLFTVFISGLNQFFHARFPSLFVTALVVQLLALPSGKLLELILPTWKFRTPIPFTGKTWDWSLNPGPFNIKEHVLITVMANVTAGGAYATDIILTQRIYYGVKTSMTYQIFLALGSQLLGYSLAGVTRRYLVWPSAMIWPGALVSCALFTTLHKNYGRKERKHMSREKFLLIATILSAMWYWVPGYLFTALSIFSWVCWIAPQNLTVNTLFGTSTGLGMGILTFDWGIISMIGSPLVTPWWAQSNVFVSLVLWYWILAPILYFKNVFYAKFMPISAVPLFDNTGAPYNVRKIVVNGVFNSTLYENYSPVFISTTLLLTYGMHFATFTATIVHVFMWYRKDIARQFRKSLQKEGDVHSRLMMAYREVPDWWFIVLGVVAFVIGLVVIEVFDTKLPVWAYMLAILLSILYIIPGGIIQAITNQTIGLNVISEVLAGYLVPGRPVAMMFFKTYAYVTMSQAIAFTADLKLGHYMKISPRLMFSAQVIATIVSCFVVIGVQEWQIDNIPNFCSPHNKDHFTCLNGSIFNTAALIWGGIGSRRIFAQHSLFFFLIGAVLPIPFYFAARRWPSSLFKYVNIPVFFGGISVIPIAPPQTFAANALVGLTFQYWMRRKHFRWWMRYNYILSASLDVGLAIGVILVFFIVQYPKGGFDLVWWGNTVWQKTADGQGLPFYQLAPNETFGPKTWS